MTLKDRGLNKWRPAFMTPELSRLHKRAAQDYYAEPKPEIDEQQMDHINKIVCESMEYSQRVVITFFQNRKSQLTIGKIHNFDDFKGSIAIVDQFGKYLELEVGEIIVTLK